MAGKDKNTRHKVRTSSTVEVMRSRIRMSPDNPKLHTDDEIRSQARNIRKNGYLLGIVWNSATGYLIDGHRRLQALDLINKYDGTPETDYAVTVVECSFDTKTELEQRTYMAVGNTKADFNRIAGYIGEIDYREAGLTDDEFRRITSMLDGPASEQPVTDLGIDLFTPPKENKRKMDAEHGKALKKDINEKTHARDMEHSQYIMLRFDDRAALEEFCAQTGLVPTGDMVLDGLGFLEKIM